LDAGHPVLVVENLGVAGKPLWNCVVAIGYDRAAQQILVNNGTDAGKRVGLRLFERLWSDSDQWGLVVLNPGDLPAVAAQPTYLAAAKGLEKAGRAWEAVLTYDAALAKWPNDGDVMMGLASSLQSLGDARGAAEAYRAAATLLRDPRPALEALAGVPE
jgi:Flp pilus assembly protein TadD